MFDLLDYLYLYLWCGNKISTQHFPCSRVHVLLLFLFKSLCEQFNAYIEILENSAHGMTMEKFCFFVQFYIWRVRLSFGEYAFSLSHNNSATDGGCMFFIPSSAIFHLLTYNASLSDLLCCFLSLFIRIVEHEKTELHLLISLRLSHLFFFS